MQTEIISPRPKISPGTNPTPAAIGNPEAAIGVGQDMSYQCYRTFLVPGSYMPFLFFSVPKFPQLHLSTNEFNFR
jgi:hypothetical protein